MAEGKAETETRESLASVIRSQELSEGERERVRLIETLAREEDRSRYLARQREVAQQLGMTVRNVQRLVRAWERDGVSGVVRQGRSDVGEHRLSEEWEAYIVETYRQGNRGGRRMSRSQVAVRVEARVRALGEVEYPSRSTVYRVLRKEIKAQADRLRVRSVGWQGEELILRTRDGAEIKVEWSNQVWQCDHTRVDLMVVDQVGEVLGRPLGRWESKREGQLPLMSDRELDICLMRRERRVMYRGGYIQFANLNYRGKHLSGYSGSWVVLRYNPRDITSILIYREVSGKDEFLSRAHAIGLETETLSYAEAKVMGKRLRELGRSISNQTMLSEVRSRDREVEEQQRRSPKRASKVSKPVEV